MRTYGVAPNVSVPYHPLFQIPGSLGQGAPGAIKAAGPVAGTIVTGEISSAASAAGSAGWAAAAGPIGAAVAAGIAIIATLLAQHEQRLKDAKTENQRAATAVSSFYGTVQGIVNALNSGQIAPADAINALTQLDQTTYQLLRQFVGTPGTAWNSSSPGVCTKDCTVSCCLYNTWLHPDVYGASGKQGLIPVIQAGGGSLNIGGIPTNKYGLPAFPKQTITINPATAAAGAAASPFSPLGGGSMSWLVLAAIAIGAGYFLSQ
jgi:hypothetical protein